MMIEHAYSLAMRRHLLTSAALHIMLLSAHEQLNDEDQRIRLRSLRTLINIDCSNIDVLEDPAIRELFKTMYARLF